jgi:hypothetical protein
MSVVLVLSIFLTAVFALGLICRRHLTLMLLARKEIEAEAAIVLERHGNGARVVIKELQQHARLDGNRAGEVRWVRVEQVLTRLQREGYAGRSI